MALQIHENLEQGSDAWFDQRRGLVTASTVGQLITMRKLSAIDYACPDCGAPVQDPCLSKNKAGAAIKSLHPGRVDIARRSPSPIVLDTASNDVSRGLTTLLVAERITGWTEERFMNDDMMRGHFDEPIARDKYSEHYAPVTECGLMVEDKWGFQIGYSPDGLVGDDGLIEIKSRRPKGHLATILAGHPPVDNMPQLQMGLLVSGRKWVDYISFCGGMPLWPKRIYPDPKWFDAIIKAVRAFEENAAEMLDIYREAVIGLYPTERIKHDDDVELKL